jgi:hypothetical protein
MPLTQSQQRFMLVDQTAIPFVINISATSLISWFAFKSESAIPLWGNPSISVDLILTAFILSFLTSFIPCLVISNGVNSGKIPSLNPNSIALHKYLGYSKLRFALTVALVAVIFFALPMIWILNLANAQAVESTSIIQFKAVWAGLLSLYASPIAGWWAWNKYSLEAPSKKDSG